DNRVILDVIVTKDEPDYRQTVDGAPLIRKNEVTAKILGADGEAIVIAEVFSSESQKAPENGHLQGNLPAVGRGFRRDMTVESKSELLVFLTPRIINNGAISLAR